MAQREVVCPNEKDDVLSAKERLGCGTDSYGNSQYICLPNKMKTHLEEFCFNGLMEMHEKGVRLLDFKTVIKIIYDFYSIYLLFSDFHHSFLFISKTLSFLCSTLRKLEICSKKPKYIEFFKSIRI